MGDEARAVRLLTGDEIAAMRQDLDLFPYLMADGRERVVATLEQFQQIVKERMDALIDAQDERDTWRAEAKDQRAQVERLEAERDRLLAELEATQAKSRAVLGMMEAQRIAAQPNVTKMVKR